MPRGFRAQEPGKLLLVEVDRAFELIVVVIFP